MSAHWPTILALAQAHVVEFERRFVRPPTLRRNHYELVSDAAATEAGYANTLYAYKRLSAVSAKARRNGSFPDFAENVRSLTQVPRFEDADDLREHIREIARVDRMAGQERSIRSVNDLASLLSKREHFGEMFEFLEYRRPALETRPLKT